ncbi:Tryptophan 2,3-dioxygenase [Alloactinosynnema sp. L-07]|nr:Tryptophan 2,3-dioxygenase [Alloactinosynnema sp. L-07]
MNEQTQQCPLFSEEIRRRQAEQTGGGPQTEFPTGNTPFVEYARMDELLQLRRPRTKALTEPAFIVMSQVKELLFDLLRTEFGTARGQLAKDAVEDALWTLRRASRIQDVLLASWDVLAALTPLEFAEFRDVLGNASGFQSVSYRRLEFLLGNKNPAMAIPHGKSPAYHDIDAQLREPSLYDEALGLLSRAGFDIPDRCLRRDFAVPYQPDDAVESAWRAVYADPGGHRRLYLLAEGLMDTADQFARWRYTHLVTVQRMLGAKPGSGGTHGVAWLKGIAEHRFFPELWSVRSTI